MKAIDTNILVRIIIKDDETQAKKALYYIKQNAEIFISLLVLCELSWVCIACYDLKKNELVKIIDNILRTGEFNVESSETVWTALHEYRSTNADFSDCLIGAIAKHHGCSKVATFDKKASNSHFFELVK
jgi:predicted nucleic-acid-binding protein